jgi:hypothetical protein
MSSTRLSNDTCYLQGINQQNVSILSRVIDPSPFVNCRPCRNELGLVGGTAVSLPRTENMVDTESKLFGIMQPSSRCPTVQPLTADTQPPMKHLSGCMIHTIRPVPLPQAMSRFSCNA